MADEAQIRLGLRIVRAPLDYQSNPTAFTMDVLNSSPPIPGKIVATPAGVDLDLTNLGVPGLIWLMNMSTQDFVTWGVVDPDTDKFLPVGELPIANASTGGKPFLHNLSRYLYTGFSGAIGTGTGTGTLGHPATLRFYSNDVDCEVFVAAFDAKQ